jgi:hypothetical protein
VVSCTNPGGGTDVAVRGPVHPGGIALGSAVFAFEVLASDSFAFDVLALASFAFAGPVFAFVFCDDWVDPPPPPPEGLHPQNTRTAARPAIPVTRAQSCNFSLRYSIVSVTPPRLGVARTRWPASEANPRGNSPGRRFTTRQVPTVPRGESAHAIHNRRRRRPSRR